MSIPAEEPRQEPTPTRLPGDFARHPGNGAPYVSHPTETTKRTGKKADLIAECARAGIAIPEGKVTVADLHELLGPRPKRVMYGRPSGFGKYIELATAIQKNAERRLALGAYLDANIPDPFAALHDFDGDLVELLDARDPELRHALDGVAATCLRIGGADLASERGSWFHLVAECIAKNAPWVHLVDDGARLGIPLSVQVAAAEAFTQIIVDFEILAVETPCVDDEWKLAGTLDLILRLKVDKTFITPDGKTVTLPAGTIVIGDLKTGNLFLDDSGYIEYWRGYSVQVASYRQSMPYDTETDTRGEWPFEMDDRWGIIVHVDMRAALAGEAVARLVLVDLEAGRHAGNLCVQARDWEKRSDIFSIPTDDLAVRVPVEIVGAASARPVAAETSVAEISSAESANGDVAGGSPTTGCSAEDPTAAPSTPPVDETQQAAGVDAPTPAADPERRAALLRRYEALNLDQKRAFLALSIPRNEFDRIERALDDVDPIASSTYTPAPRPPAPELPVAPAAPDEGTAVSAEDVAALQRRFTALPEAAKAWTGALIQQGNEGFAWRIKDTPTVRRYELYRAVLAWIEHVGDPLATDEALRQLLSQVLADEAPLQLIHPLGAVLGLCGANQAARLALMVDAFCAGRMIWSPEGSLVDLPADPAALELLPT